MPIYIDSPMKTDILKDRNEAERLVLHKHEALKTPRLNGNIAMAYPSAAKPRLVRRT